MKKLILSLSVVFLASGLSACEKTKEQFDFSKKAPDEFAVVTRAPLEMPPDYNLRPPRPGVQRPQEDTAIDDAKQAVFGEQPVEQADTKQLSEGEAILLRKTGATDTSKDIRQVIDQETAEIVKDETPTIDRLLGKVGKKVDAPASVVDPVKETERLTVNKATGKSVTDGKTPTIEE